MASAIAAAEDGDVIALAADVELTSLLNINVAKEITINLNGYDITRENGTGIYVNNADANLTIEGSGTVTATAGALYVNAGTVVVNGGTYIGLDKDNEVGTIIARGSNSKVVINNATVNSEEFCFRSWASAQTTINGGVFSSDMHTIWPCESSSVTINGGTFSAGEGYVTRYTEHCDNCVTSGVIIADD